MNSSLNSDEHDRNNIAVVSFCDSLSSFLKNVKIESKDVFELLNYPCVFQNYKRRVNGSDRDHLQNSFKTNVISKIDKKNIEKLREQKRQLHRTLLYTKSLYRKYKLGFSLKRIFEILITYHLIIENKINNIVRKIQEHNIVLPELNSDLPYFLINTIEVEEPEEEEINRNEYIPKVSELNSLSIHDGVLRYFLEKRDLRVNLEKLSEYYDEPYAYAESVQKESILNNSVKSNHSLYYNPTPEKPKEEKCVIQDLGLSEETLKLLNILPKPN